MLDQSSDYTPWRHEQVIISRPSRSASRKRPASHAQSNQISWNPWSLLLGSSAEADQTAFWFVMYVEPEFSWPEIRIVDVYPPRQFDGSSRQLRTDPIPERYYNLNRFRIIDGIVDLSIVLTYTYKDVYSCPKLLVGRQASSRRQTPQPWCQFVGNLESVGVEKPHADFIAQYESDSPAPDGPNVTIHEIIYGFKWNHIIRVSVRKKEISGVVHYLAAVELVQKHDIGDGAMPVMLQREDPHDCSSEAIKNVGDAGPLRL